MSKPPPRQVDPSILSVRERAVVDGAVEGYTDEQIAQSLNIAVSTVNSYWSRIRAKVGALSRTEIATQFLRREMEERCAALEAEIKALRTREDAIREAENLAEDALKRQGGEGWRYLTLAHLAVATMVVAQSGMVLYANPLARYLFLAARNELDGQPFWQLTHAEDGSSCKKRLREFFADREVPRTVAGLEQPYYALRRDGTQLRIILAAEWFESPDGVIATVVLREYSEDAIKLVKSFHQPATMR